MTEKSTWVINCCYESDQEIDLGYLIVSAVEVKAFTRKEAMQELKKKLGNRLREIIRMTEWPPGSFDAYVAKISSKS